MSMITNKNKQLNERKVDLKKNLGEMVHLRNFIERNNKVSTQKDDFIAILSQDVKCLKLNAQNKYINDEEYMDDEADDDNYIDDDEDDDEANNDDFDKFNVSDGIIENSIQNSIQHLIHCDQCQQFESNRETAINFQQTFSFYKT